MVSRQKDEGRRGLFGVEIGWDFLFFCVGWVRWVVSEKLKVKSEKLRGRFATEFICHGEFFRFYIFCDVGV